ncbi:MAG: replication-associated recombination protein A, partial [Methylobacterium sp.]
MSDLFGSSEPAPPPEPAPESGVNRPLADRLRPRTLDEVVGQEHLTGEGGALTRLLRGRNLGSLIFWG